jgi:hypothetical protein
MQIFKIQISGNHLGFTLPFLFRLYYSELDKLPIKQKKLPQVKPKNIWWEKR